MKNTKLFNVKRSIAKNFLLLSNNLIILITLLSVNEVFLQSVKGKITDDTNQVLSFVNIIEKGTTNGVVSNENGEFELNLKNSPAILVITSIGYTKTEKKVISGSTISVKLVQGDVLNEVVLTGSRTKPRTVLDSPVAIDNIGLAELQSTGKSSVDKMLTYTVPSYNSSTQAISDASAYFDPADLRGLGPSRTLVLVNGKRKNQTAQVYTNDIPGKGEVGTDLTSIPTTAIKRVEVLRDGASAQYGSDAIAGVINLILKENVNLSEVNVSSGITSKGDGLTYGADVNHTFTIGDKGFINGTFNLSHQDYTDRSGTPGKDILFGVENSWTKSNPDLGVVVGQPRQTIGNLFLNANYDINDSFKIYSFGGYNTRIGKAFCLYRTPYWVKDPHYLLHKKGTKYQGFQPDFRANINDIGITAGSTFNNEGINVDLSLTYGGNFVEHNINNTLNQSLGVNSPTNFYAGGYGFNNIIGNLDASKTFNKISFGGGIEVRQESFEVKAGQRESYIGKGSESYPGYNPSNVVNKSRHNIGSYTTFDWDLTNNFLLGGAVRFENFSDFGSNVSYKLNSRYKFKDLVFRGSYSTGFRAPSLHQVYFSMIKTIPGNSGLINEGTFNNTSKVVSKLGVRKLFAEKSKNLSFGFTLKPTRKFNITFDYYNVKIKDRVLLSGQINDKDDNGNTNTTIASLLKKNNIQALNFFFNTLNTTTHGIDLALLFKNLKIERSKFDFNAALNLNRTKLNGKINVPNPLKDYKKTLFNREEQSRIESARPNVKILYGINYKLDALNVTLNNTYFGKVTWKHAQDSNKDQTFRGKTLTDLAIGYKFTDIISCNVGINNIFNVYPDEIEPKGDDMTNLGGRIKYPWDVNQFGFNGTTFKAGLKFRLQ